MLIDRGHDVNLEELRAQLTSRIGWLLIVGASLMMWIELLKIEFPFLPVRLVEHQVAAMWLSLLKTYFPISALALWSGLLVLGLGVQVLREKYATLGRHLMVWGLTAGLAAGMYLFSETWIPFLALPLAFICALLVSYSQVAIAALTGGLALWYVHIAARAYPSQALIVALLVGMIVAWLASRTLYTALEWAWTMQRRADDLLELSRDRQGELNRTLKSLDLAYTLQRRIQRELFYARRQAEEARRMKEQFAANISHELRTPLNLILGFSEIMYLSPEVYGEINWPSALRRDIYHIYRSSRHLLEMIDDILDLSRFDLAEFTLHKEPTALADLLNNAAGIAGDLFRVKQVVLRVELADDLPTLEVDRTRIRQVLLNLLNNAQRFTDVGYVKLAAVRDEREVVISVSDTGAGIPADKLPLIFDEFYQVDYSMRRSHEGAGLGLAICKRFVEAHNGRIWVESQEGEGSTFFFTLPIPAQHADSAYSPHVVRPVEPAWPDARPAILVADPDPRVADLINRHVAVYDVIQVADPEQIDQAIILHHPRAVMVNVPPGRGSDAGGHSPLAVPFIECSLPSQSWVASDLQVSACLTKPIVASDLLESISQVGGPVRRILIIDDDRGFCHLVERILQTSSHIFDVSLAYDGADGLVAMRRQRPDLVLLDLIMPGVDGFQVLEEMQDDRDLVETPVILLTATSYAEDALARRSNQIVIRRADGLRPAEVLRCLEAVVGVLEPDYSAEPFQEELLGEGL